MNLGKTIKRLRNKAGLHQKELAICIEVTQGYISQVERGEKNPSMALLKRIASLFNTSVFVLLFLSMEEEDVLPERRALFHHFYPQVAAFIEPDLG